jgi:cytoskeletal protein CcmA (bactofilin family)
MPAFLSRPALTEAISIACYHCGHRQDVGRKAQTVTCSKCHKPLQVSDVQVKRYDARREVRTVGTVVVEKKGQIVADRVECGGLIARGQIKTKHATTVRGSLLVGPKASLAGTVEAYCVSVEEGAEVDGYFCVGKEHMTPPPPPPPPPPPVVIEQEEAFPSSADVDAPARTSAVRQAVKPPLVPAGTR